MTPPHYLRWLAAAEPPCPLEEGWRADYDEWVRKWKDGLELNYWTMAADLEEHRSKLALYIAAWSVLGRPANALEIGCGPLGGVLSILQRIARRVGVDPNVDEYRAAGFLAGLDAVEFVPARFDEWHTDERFDAIFSADSLDHGSMGFHLIPRIFGMLNPGGRFYLHVHLRKPEQLNETHDHALTLEQLDAALSLATDIVDVVEMRRQVYATDLDGYPLETLVAVWQRSL